MENNLIGDLDLLLEDTKFYAEHLNHDTNITLLDEDKNESKDNLEAKNKVLRAPSEILQEYTNKEDEILKIKLNIEKFKDTYSKVFEEYQSYLDAINEIEEAQNGLKEELTKSLENSGIKTISNSKFKATFVASTTRSTFDTTRFKKKYPVLYNDFIKVSNVKAYTKIKEVE